jgi:hypothetical protein
MNDLSRRSTDHGREQPEEFWKALGLAMAGGVVILVGVFALIAWLT